MRSTSTYSTWLEVAPSAQIHLTYLEEQVRRAGWARPGALLAERYQLEAPLAASTPTTLWQARPFGGEAAALERRGAGPFTLQLLDPALAEDAGMLEAFFQEARAAAQIDHAHVTRVLDYGVDYGRDAGVPFLVLERLSGETLEDRLSAQRRLSTQELSRIFREAARGLEALHARGLVHRRLDPAHLFLTTELSSTEDGAQGFQGQGLQGHGDQEHGDQEHGSPRTQILFAIDEVFGDNLRLVRKLTHQLSGRVRAVGKWDPELDELPASEPPVSERWGHEQRARFDTAEYQSPEQLLGHELIDERSDLWSLAVIAFEALAGTPAFSGASLGERLVQICSGEPNLAPPEVALPPGFGAWFQRGVQKRPSERFRSAREMADALALVLGP
jgi:serine/threonine protein kinase